MDYDNKVVSRPVPEGRDYHQWTREQKDALVSAWDTEHRDNGISQTAFAKEIGVKESAFGYWVGQWRKRHGKVHPVKSPVEKASEQGSTAIVAKSPDKAPSMEKVQQESEWLQAVLDETRRELTNANAKIEALQKVILVLGHQLED